MALTSDEQQELEDLKARRRKTAGIRATTFSDQSTTFDNEGLDRRIASLEAKARTGGGSRLAAFRKGV